MPGKAIRSLFFFLIGALVPVHSRAYAQSAICYAAPTGNDANDGSYWAFAKADVMSCYDALPSGGGTIYIRDDSNGQHVGIRACKPTDPPGCGIWLMGGRDPNYTNPPPGWRRAKTGGAGAVDFIGVGGTTGNMNVDARVRILCGAPGGPNPCVWLSDARANQFRGLDFAAAGQKPILLSVDSTGKMRPDAASWMWLFEDCSFTSQLKAGYGPTITIGTNTFWAFLRDSRIYSSPQEAVQLSTMVRSGGAVTATAGPMFTLTSIAKTGTSAIYTGTITGSLYMLGSARVTIRGFANRANNGTFSIGQYSKTTLTVNNPNAVPETHTATASIDLPPSWSGTMNIGVVGAADPSFNGLFTATITGPDTFLYSQKDLPDGTTSGGAASSDAAQAIVVNPAPGIGVGDVFFDRLMLAGGGGIRVYGRNDSTVYARDIYTEAGYAPVVELSTCTAGRFENIAAADLMVGVADVRVDNAGADCAKGRQPPVVMNASVDGPAVIAAGARPYTAFSLPDAQGQIGSAGGKVFEQTDTPRRAFGPVAAPHGYVDLAKQDPSTWGSGGCAGAAPGHAALAPDGTMNAGLVSTSQKSAGPCLYNAVDQVEVGDTYVYGGWAMSNHANGYARSSAFALNSATPSCTFSGASRLGPAIGGGGEWDFLSGFAIFAGNSGKCRINFFGVADSTHPTTFYAPVLIHIPAAAGLSTNEVAEMALHLQSFRSDASPGQVSLLRGEQFKADSIQVGDGPTITSGAGAPAGSATVGSIYLRRDGVPGATLYVYEKDGWKAVK